MVARLKALFRPPKTVFYIQVDGIRVGEKEYDVVDGLSNNARVDLVFEGRIHTMYPGDVLEIAAK